MKRLIVISIIGICVWLTYQYPHAMLSPGELVDGHRKLNEKCLSCHTHFLGIDSEKCMSCHKLSEIGKDTIHGNDTIGRNGKILFHQNFTNRECTSCHTDHKGVKPNAAISSFTHELLPETERNKCNGCHSKPADKIHKQLASSCSNCHHTAGWKSSVVFNHDMIQGADKNNCVSCHQAPADDFHRKMTGECLSCHTTSKWKPSTFNHDKYFRFDEHHPETCVNCHTTKNYNVYTCYNCHEHTEGKIMQEHIEHRITDLANCVRCHKSGNEHDVEGGRDSKDQLNQKDNNVEKKYHEGEGKQDDD